MTLHLLDLNETKALYQPCLTRDFPPDERMPWNRMEELIGSGKQASVGFYDGESLAAYAIFIVEGKNAPAALLNYFAVEPDRRDQGVGSQCLGLLRQALRETPCAVLFEVESPENASTPEELAIRQRRVSFYRRCGAVDTGVDSTLFGVDYHIMLLPPAGEEAPRIDSEKIAHDLEELYRSMIPSEYTYEQVCRVSVGEKGQEQGRFSRELGRALTFLFRGRKKFMGEKLKEYDFTGAMYLILLHVARHPGASQDSIANHMYLDKCSVARRTKKLEELGYLYRETDWSDRRQNKLYLTEKGEELAPVIRGYLAQWGEQTAAGLSQEEKAELLRLLTKMTGQDKR